MNIQDLRDERLILLECISGSKAYGLDTPTSDSDIKGVFLLPKETYYGMNYIPQISNPTNDIVFYEFGRFMELLSLNNPNILELLNTPESSVLYKHPFLNELNPAVVLSKLCKNTFGKFALSQIKKAKGLKKKIVNPMDKERKSLLSFCHVNCEQGSMPLHKFLEIRGWEQEECGLVNIPHMKDIYGMYHAKAEDFKGIIKKDSANDVALSSIPKGLDQVALLYFNKNGYSSYCKEYKEYWDWVELRNEERFKNTEGHGKKYDAKNMMHTFRLLDMAIEIATDGQINVQRPNRKFLLAVKAGEFEYAELLEMANERKKQMELAFETSDLQEKPDLIKLNRLTYELRNRFYREKSEE